MPAIVRAELNTADAQRAIAALGQKAKPAIARALNRSAITGRAFMARQVASELGLAVGVVKEQITVDEARPDRLQVTFSASAKRIPLIDFKARGPEPSLGRGRGVTARLPGGAGRYPQAFIATMATGHRGVFQRKPGAKRKPIYELRGPSIWQAFEKHQPAAQQAVGDALTKNLQHEFEYALSRG